MRRKLRTGGDCEGVFTEFLFLRGDKVKRIVKQYHNINNSMDKKNMHLFIVTNQSFQRLHKTWKTTETKTKKLT